jgi:hypothetical protein
MMFGLNCATLMRALLRLNILIKILIIYSIKLSLRNLMNLLMDCFTRFKSIVSTLRSYGAVAYSDNERAK